MKKKGQGLSAVPAVMVTLLAVIIIIFFLSKFVGTIQGNEPLGCGGDACAELNASMAYNATVAGGNAVKNINANVGLWGLAIGIGVSIAIILGALYFVRR